MVFAKLALSIIRGKVMQSKCESCIYDKTSECENCIHTHHDVGTADRDYHLSDHYVMNYQSDEYFESVENTLNGQFS